MVSCGNLLKSVLVAVILVTLAGSGSAEIKPWTCCEKVSTKEITEPIIGYKLQGVNHPCVPAVIFQTEKRHYCTYIKAPWVEAKIEELNLLRGKLEASARAASTSSSLLSIIKSTSSPPSFSTSQNPLGESPSDQTDQ